MSIIMALWVLLGFGANVPLSAEEMITKDCHNFGQNVEHKLSDKGVREYWRHSEPAVLGNDRTIERSA